MDSRTLNSKRNLIVSGISTLVTTVFGLIIKSAIIRFFSVEYIGLTSVIGSVISIITLVEFGFTSVAAINLFTPIKDGDTPAVRKLLSFYRRIYRTIGAAILILGICAVPFLMLLLKDVGEIQENIYVLYFFYVLDASINYLMFGYIEALFHAAQRLDVTRILFMIVYVLKNCLQLIAISFFRNFYLFAMLFAAGTILYNIFLKIASVKMFRDYYPEGKEDQELRHIAREQAIGLSIANIMGTSRNSIDSFIITSLFGLALAGMYSNYFVIYNAIFMCISLIVRSIRASVGNSIVSESVEKNLSDFTKMEFLLNILITACAAYMVSLYQPFMKIWMGEDLIFNDYIMILFVIYYYVRAIPGVRHAYFGALGYWWKAKWIYITELLLNILLNIILGRFFGVAGIIIATICTDLVLEYYAVNNILFRDYFGQGKGRYYADRIIYTVIAFITCGVSYYLCNRVIVYEGITGIIIRLIVCTVTIILIVPLMMFLLRRRYLKISAAFVKQIIKA